nr:hypothetical protein [Allomuricauda sp.]
MVQELLNFLRENYNIGLYLVTWVIAVYRYRRYFDTVMRFFPIFIMYTFLTELLGYFIKYNDNFQFFSGDSSWHNVIIYNLYSIVSFLFFFYIYWVVLKKEKNRKIVKYGAILSMLVYVTSTFFQDPFHINLYYADLVASLFLVYCIWIYFQEKKSEEDAPPLSKNLLFWVSLGLVIFHIPFPFIFLAAYEAPAFYSTNNLHQVLMGLIVVMYALFIIGFWVGQRKAFR